MAMVTASTITPTTTTTTVVAAAAATAASSRTELAQRPADRLCDEKLALGHHAVVKALEGSAPKKVIVVPGRIVNVVV